MTFRLYDTLTKQKRDFVPLEPGVVKMYNCGPTVYGHAHIGNFRSFLFADVLRRYLEYRGFRVHQVMNITDVGHLTEDDLPSGGGDDKLEAEAARQGKTPWDIARFYTHAFFDDLRFLRLREADVYPEATKHIREMIQMIEQLIHRGHAYESNGSVYFDVASFPEYGRLSGNTLEDLDAGARVEVLSEKRHAHDFALWKKDPKHLMQWDSPWGRGFPGWHIECSAMARRYLGVTFDIHTGGEDNIFPHHECEIAQSVSANEAPFVNYWVHGRHLLVDGQKMSKSRGTFYLLSDLRERGHSAEAIRHAFTSTQYGTPQNFTWESMEASGKAIERLNAFWRNLDANPKAKDRADVAALTGAAKRSFDEAMADDLNSSAAFAAVFELVNGINRLDGGLSKKDVERVRSLLKAFDSVFVFLRPEIDGGGAGTERKIQPPEIDQLIAQRNSARAREDWALADQIRDGLLKKGVVIEDVDGGGTRWHWA